MTCIGKVLKGAIKLPPGVDLPDGTAVELILPDEPQVKRQSEADSGWFYKEFKDFVGIIKEGPPDMAENHDHYAHGAAKRKKS